MKKSPLYKLAVFASGEGTNAETIIKHFYHHPDIRVSLVLSNNPGAGVLPRAARHQVPSLVFNKTQLSETGEVMSWLHDNGITHIVLAGFMWLLPSQIIQRFPDRIINIHPALLPKFGGKGMYGRKVHEAVRTAGVTETGITIHLVNERYDEGEVILQIKCSITPGDSVEDIALKVRKLEHEYYPQAIEQWVPTA